MPRAPDAARLEAAMRSLRLTLFAVFLIPPIVAAGRAAAQEDPHAFPRPIVIELK